MNSPVTSDFIWATRGRTWGFRFLRHGGFTDPLVAYDKAFSGVPEGAQACRRNGGRIALRFPDPEGRRDSAGRLILHEIVLPEDSVVQGHPASEIKSVEDGLRIVWPAVRDDFERVWDEPMPPLVDG